jgi:hypothetical protein
MPSSVALSIVPAGKGEVGQWLNRSRFLSGPLGPAQCGVVNIAAQPDRGRTISAGLDFTLACRKIRSQRSALKSVPGSNEGGRAVRQHSLWSQSDGLNFEFGMPACGLAFWGQPQEKDGRLQAGAT